MSGATHWNAAVKRARHDLAVEIAAEWERIVSARRDAGLNSAEMAHDFAVKFGLRSYMTREQASELERDLTTYLRYKLDASR